METTPEPYQATILADSIAYGVRLTTMVATFPRFILAEFNTHRVFSRNSASSRAIPVKKRIAAIKENPYVPLSFGKNKRGMQAGEDLDSTSAAQSRDAWMEAMHDAVKNAEVLVRCGLHKQWANRILEPFAWHTVIVTATEWDNYWALRISTDAQPEIHLVSENMKEALRNSVPTELVNGDWHTPLIFEEDINECLDQTGVDEEKLAKISAARCARVSYLTHDGKRSIEKDLELYHRLVSAGHMSPLEHVAQFNRELAESGTVASNFRSPWVQYRKLIPGESCFEQRD